MNLPITNGSNPINFFVQSQSNLPSRLAGVDSPTNYLAWSNGSAGGQGFGSWNITATGAGSFLAETTTLGFDSAANYSNLWTNGSVGGTGFKSWKLQSGGTGVLLLGSPTNAGIQGMGAKAFQLRALASSNNSYANAERDLSQALAVGQTLSFLWGINWDTDTVNGHKGFNLYAGTNEIVNVNNANTSAITLNGTNVGFNYGNNVMRWSFKLVAANSLEVRANGRDGNGSFFTNLTVLGAPSALRFYAANMGTNDSASREPYFDELRIEGPYPNLDLGSIQRGLGLWASSNGVVTASRNLLAEMQAGDALLVRFDNNLIDPDGEVGLALRDISGKDRFRFYFVGGQFVYKVDDQVTNRNTSIGYTSGGLPLTFTLTGSDTYALNTGFSPVTGTLASGGPITQIAFFNKGAGPGTERNFYVGEMSLTEQRTTNVVIPLAEQTVFLSTATDGIPNSWWEQYSSITNRLATADPDGDGWSNAQEFAFGLAPNVAGGKLVEIDANNPTKIVFLQRDTGVSSYAVRAASDLGSGFTNTVTAALSTNTNNVPAGYKRYEATFPSGNRGFLKVDATVSP